MGLGPDTGTGRDPRARHLYMLIYLQDVFSMIKELQDYYITTFQSLQ
jgi:hypothetical protein